MKKTLAAVVATASLSLATVVAGAPSGAVAPAGPAASATSPQAAQAAAGCVTRLEYRKVKKGFTKARVHRIFGTSGIQVDKRGSFEARGYVGCGSRASGVGVVYRNGRLANKAAQW